MYGLTAVNRAFGQATPKCPSPSLLRLRVPTERNREMRHCLPAPLQGLGQFWSTPHEFSPHPGNGAT